MNTIKKLIFPPKKPLVVSKSYSHSNASLHKESTEKTNNHSIVPEPPSPSESSSNQLETVEYNDSSSENEDNQQQELRHGAIIIGSKRNRSESISEDEFPNSERNYNKAQKTSSISSLEESQSRSDSSQRSNSSDEENYKEIIKPPTKFRLQRQLISLTVWNLKYQGRNITKEVVYNNIIKFFCKPIFKLEWFIVAREFGPLTGGEHLHVLIYFKKKIDTRDYTFFNKITHQVGFPDLQVNICESQNMATAVEYVTKGGVFRTYGDVPVGQLKKDKPLEIICRHLLDKSKSMAMLRKEFPTVFVIHGKKIEDFYNRIMEDKKELSLKQWDVRCINQEGLNEYELKVLKWIFENYPPICNKNNYRALRRHKQKQLYICGRADSYKSSLVMALDEFFEGYPIQGQEDFYDSLCRDQYKYGFLFIDEFNGNKMITHLNQLLEGVKMTLRAKGSQFIKEINYPIVILSNSRLEECYRNAKEIHHTVFEALTVRLEIVELYMGDFDKSKDSEVRKYTLKTLTERIRNLDVKKQYDDIHGFMKGVKLSNNMKEKLLATDQRVLELSRTLGLYGSTSSIDNQEEGEEEEGEVEEIVGNVNINEEEEEYEDDDELLKLLEESESNLEKKNESSEEEDLYERSSSSKTKALSNESVMNEVSRKSHMYYRGKERETQARIVPLERRFDIDISSDEE